jgi:hypothetical protein
MKDLVHLGGSAEIYSHFNIAAIVLKTSAFPKLVELSLENIPLWEDVPRALSLFRNSCLWSLRLWNCANELDLLVTLSRHNLCNALRYLEISFDHSKRKLASL